MKLTGAQILCETLERLGVRHIFGYPGGAILPVYDALGFCYAPTRRRLAGSSYRVSPSKKDLFNGVAVHGVRWHPNLCLDTFRRNLVVGRTFRKCCSVAEAF